MIRLVTQECYYHCSMTFARTDLRKGKTQRRSWMLFPKVSRQSYRWRKVNLLFRFIQYIERQVVLFDAIEDAAFPIINNMDGIGTLRSSKENAFSNGKKEELRQYLRNSKFELC